MREIWIHREISRIQIAKNLGLDKSTVTSITVQWIAIADSHIPMPDAVSSLYTA